MALRIKICGITTAEDARTAAELGANAIGLNLWPDSPRAITHQQAAAIAEILPPFVEPVAVFVNNTFRDIKLAMRKLGSIRTFQWHGTEHELSDPAPYRYLPAFSIRNQESLDSIRSYLDCCREGGYMPCGVLVDAHVTGHYGGTGQVAPWDLLTKLKVGVPIVLAGGLNPENVAEAVRKVRPYAVDVATGVEKSPGKKDSERILRFIRRAREAASEANE